MVETSRVVDRFGNPYKLKALRESQTGDSKLGFIQSEFANHPSRGLTPGKLSKILEDAERGDLRAQCELFEDMEEKDGHIFAELAKRKRALLGIDFDIVPPPNATAAEIKTADLLEELLLEFDLDDIIFDMADAIGKGYSNLEFDGWHRVENYWLPKDIEHRDPTWFTVNQEDRNTLLLRTNDGMGEALRPFTWISHVHKSKSGYVTRAGLGRILSWPYLFKNYSVRDLAEFLEIYGLPLRLGKYPSGATDADKMTLLRAVTGIGHNAAGIIPTGMEIDFHEASKGNTDPFESMMSWCERTQSKAILGGTLTSQADGKSSTNALGNVHNEVRMDLRDSDLKQIAASLSEFLLYPLAALNAGVTNMRRSPRLIFDTREPEDLKLYSEALPGLVEMGMQIEVEYAHDKLRIPMAEKNKPVLQRATAIPADSVIQAVASLSSTVDSTPDQTAINNALKDLPPEVLQAQADQLLEPILGKIEAGGDLTALAADVETLFPTLNTEQLETTLTQLFFVAEVWGRLNA